MIFTPANCQLILQNLKTQTRRVQRAGDQLVTTAGTITAVCRHGRRHWQVGRTYAVQPGRGAPQVGRIRLTAIRQQRLQDISPSGALAEGISPIEDHGVTLYTINRTGLYYFSPQEGFTGLWNSLNRKPGERWHDNPLVYVLEFEVVR